MDDLRIMLSGKDPCDLWSRSDKSFKMPVETARDHGLQLVVARKKNGGTRQHHGQWSARSEEMESQLQRTKQSRSAVPTPHGFSRMVDSHEHLGAKITPTRVQSTAAWARRQASQTTASAMQHVFSNLEDPM